MSGDPTVYPNYSYEFLKAHPEYQTAAKLDFIRSMDNTRSGAEWRQGIQRAEAQKQQIRPRRSTFVEVTDDRGTGRDPNSRALNVPLRDGKPDFSHQGYISTLSDKEKIYGKSVSGGGTVENTAAFMAEGDGGRKDVASRTHYRTTTGGQDFYLTQYHDKSYEIRTRTGQLVDSGSEWNAFALEDAQYKLSGDYLWDKKNRPLDYAPPTLQGKQIRIIDDGRGPVQVSSTEPATKEAYKRALLAGFGDVGGGTVDNTAAFMGEGLSRDAAVQSRSVYLSKVSSSPTEDIYRRYWMTDYGPEGAELRTSGGQIILSSGTNDPAAIEAVLESRPMNAGQGGKIYEIAPATVTPDQKTQFVKVEDKQQPVQETDWISQKVSESLGFLQGLDKALPTVPESVKVGLALSTFAGPSGAPRFIADMLTGQKMYNLEYNAADEIVSHPADTIGGGVILGGYGLYEMGKAAVTDPVGSVVRLPQTVPAALSDTENAFKGRPLQTLTSLYVGGKVLKAPGRVVGKLRPSTEAPVYKPKPLPELEEIPADVPRIFAGIPTMEKAWTPPRTVTIADQPVTTPTRGISPNPEIHFRPDAAVMSAEIVKGLESTSEGLRLNTRPISMEFKTSPAVSGQAISRPRTGTGDATKIPVLDLTQETTHTSSIPFTKKQGLVTESYDVRSGRIEKSARFTPDAEPGIPDAEITLRDYLSSPEILEAQRITMHQNAELAREFGPQILRAEHLHFGPLDMIREQAPMTAADWARLQTPDNLPILEYTQTKYPDAKGILNIDQAVKVSGYSERIPESAMKFDVPEMNLEYIRNPSDLYAALTGDFKIQTTKSPRPNRKSSPLFKGFSEQELVDLPLREKNPRVKAAREFKGTFEDVERPVWPQSMIISEDVLSKNPRVKAARGYGQTIQEPKPQAISAEKVLRLEREPKQPPRKQPATIERSTAILGMTGAMRAASRESPRINQITGGINLNQIRQTIDDKRQVTNSRPQIRIPNVSRKPDHILQLAVKPAMAEAQKRRSEEKIVILQRSRSDVMQDQQQMTDSVQRQLHSAQGKPMGKPQPKIRPAAKPVKKTKTAISDDVFAKISGSLDIPVINPRVALRDLKI